MNRLCSERPPPTVPSIKDLGVHLVAASFCTPSPDSGVPLPGVWPTLSLQPSLLSLGTKRYPTLFLQGSPPSGAGDTARKQRQLLS